MEPFAKPPRAPNPMPRRAFLGAVPAALAAAPALARQAAGQGDPAPRLAADALDCAERLIGLDFNEAEEEMARAAASRNLDSYERLRQLDVPLDTEPAVAFRPYLPGQRPPASGARARVLAVNPPAVRLGASLDDLAFQPVAALARLFRAREVSSTDLTRMYLARLKRYGETLRCIVTLTEDLALEQAARADRELKDGRYRGQLHGIPWGAKEERASWRPISPATPRSA